MQAQWSYKKLLSSLLGSHGTVNSTNQVAGFNIFLLTWVVHAMTINLPLSFRMTMNHVTERHSMLSFSYNNAFQFFTCFLSYKVLPGVMFFSACMLERACIFISIGASISASFKVSRAKILKLSCNRSFKILNLSPTVRHQDNHSCNVCSSSEVHYWCGKYLFKMLY